MKAAALFFAFVTSSLSVHASSLQSCGNVSDFKSSVEMCAKANGQAASSGNWKLAVVDGADQYWLDTKANVVWGPTNAKFENGSIYSWTFDYAKDTCDKMKGQLPTVEDFYLAYTWSWAGMTLPKSKFPGTSVFWAISTYHIGEQYQLWFDANNNLAPNMPVMPKTGLDGADFRCVWRL